MSYQSEVLADSPYLYYRDASAAPWDESIGGTLDIAITGATVLSSSRGCRFRCHTPRGDTHVGGHTEMEWD